MIPSPKKVAVSMILGLVILFPWPNTSTSATAKVLTQTALPAAFSVITMYSSVESCSTAKCIMASGKSAYIGAAACPRKYPLGTKIRIAGKIYTCEDRTAKRFDGRFDLFAGYGKEAHAGALRWGKRSVSVESLP